MLMCIFMVTHKTDVYYTLGLTRDRYTVTLTASEQYDMFQPVLTKPLRHYKVKDVSIYKCFPVILALLSAYF